MRHRLCAIAIIGLLLLMPAAQAAKGNQAPKTAGPWLFYRWHGGLSPYRYWELGVSQSGRATFRMDYLKHQVRADIVLDSGELAYLRHLTAPLAGLVGHNISLNATDLGQSKLQLFDGKEVIELEWVRTEQPDLLALVGFVGRLANHERCRILLASNQPEVIYNGTHEVLSNLKDIFRPRELCEQLWQVVERWPLPGLSGVRARGARSTLANAVMALGDLEPKEEWAGRIMKTIERLPRDDQLFAVIALSPYVVNIYHQGTPWSELTPLFVSQLALAQATPKDKRSWRENQAISDLKAALRKLEDPRAKAALSVTEQ